MAPRSRAATTGGPRRTRSSGRRGAEPRPSALHRYLLDSERLVFEVRRHGTVLAGATAGYVLLVVVAFLFLGFANGSGPIATTGLVVLLAATAWYAWKVGDWWVERFSVTDRRVLLVSGLLTRRVAIMPLRKVTDLTFERSFAGRMFGYGAFVMESAGQHQALSRIDFLPRPEALYLQMSDLLFGSGGADHDPDEDGDVRRSGRRPAGTTRPDDAAVSRPDRPPVTRRPPVGLPPPPGGATRRTPVGGAAAAPAHARVTSAGSPPMPSATSPLPRIPRDRPDARRPRGRPGSGERPPGRDDDLSY